MKPIVLQVKSLSRHFKNVKAVDSLDLTVRRGEIYGFLGPNGCGKTTTIRLLTGLLTPSAGEIDILGCTLPGEESTLRRKIGYMTQNFSLYREMTARENLTFMARAYGLNKADRVAAIDKAARQFNLSDLLDQMSGSMSGGQRQRLSLAAATLHQPELLFLDEPTSAVDPENRRDFWEKLFDLSDAGTTILVSTHYMDEAERCHKLAILDKGVKRADGAPSQLMQSLPASVIEVQTDQPRLCRKSLLKENTIISVAQIGSNLRVLISNDQLEPLNWLSDILAQQNIQLSMVAPNLEDVFVLATRNDVGDTAND